MDNDYLLKALAAVKDNTEVRNPNLDAAAKTIGSMPTPEDPNLSGNLKAEWNKYVDWLEKKGMKGSADLDKNGLGAKMIETYRKENPSTPITNELIPTIQKEFSKYREWKLADIKKGKAGFAEGTNEENFMKSLSVVDGIAGQRTTSFRFPDEYLKIKDLNTGQVTIENKGFAKL